MKKSEVKCHGFLESAVLKVKTEFSSSDMQQLLILKDDGRIIYHNRDCVGKPYSKTNISAQCKHWFDHVLVNIQATEEIYEGDVKTEDLIEVTQNIMDGSRTKNSNFQVKIEKQASISNAPTQETIIEEPFYKDYTLTKVNLNQQETHLLSIQGESLLRINKLDHNYSETSNKNEYNKTNKELSENFENESKIHEENDTSHRKSVLRKSKNIEEHNCDVCNKVFSLKCNLTKHMKIHTKGANECSECHQKVKDLNKHMKNVHQNKDSYCYFCDICGRGFKDSGAYSYHKTGHTGERNYPCSTCNKQYRNSSEQKKCERGHQGLFKYICSICGYRTHQKNKYTRHSRIHSKQVPFTCPICYLSLARKDYLQKHVTKKHGCYSLQQLETMFPKMYNIDKDHGISLEDQINAAEVTFE